MSVANMTSSGAGAAGDPLGAAGDALRGLGRMFYLVSPQDTLYETPEEVPNFYRQSWPYFFLLMLLEHCLLRLEGRKGIRLNDGLTSLSNGLFQECGKLVWRGAECYLYTCVHARWRLLELPWDSAVTWYAAALGVDFCYYWMHRACHEIHILWAQHQVHHTSEDFNMGVGVRQSVLQGWCGVVFYLPLALIIPPAQFVLHQQFSYLYMFWLHTESINTLGPLEYVLNTPSHHRVHHGSNKYCLDVNYGGLLIVWDRLFGTYADERDKEEIVYGLIYNQPSFNPLHLQTFYTRYVVEKFHSYDSWGDKFRAVFHRPSWAPDTPPNKYNEILVVENRPRFDVQLPIWCNVYLLLHYAIVLYAFHELALRYMGMTPLAVLPFVAYVIGSLTIIGMLFDGSSRAPPLEVARCSVLAFLAQRWLAAGWNPVVAAALQIIFVVSAMLWALYSLKLFEIKSQKTEAPKIE